MSDMLARTWSRVASETIRGLRARAAEHERIAAMGAQDSEVVQRMLAEMDHPTYRQQAIAERALADQIASLIPPTDLST